MNSENLAELCFGLVGGLGIFLLGMKHMSEGMQAVAGDSLRRMIGAVTTNRFLAVGVGTLVTTTIQSSSITTVMAVGFVNSGMMTLTQAIGVIMGANIGTTITGWFIALKIGKYGLPLLGVAAFVYLFSKGDRRRNWAIVVMGIGMVFLGLEFMKDACKVISEVPEFEKWFHKFVADNYFGVLKCALAGCLLTFMVQSSSATLGITIALATEGVITYETAAALVLGENIGTTITAYLASLGATTNARRAAYFHIIFNVLGVLWITLIFRWYVVFIQRIVPEGIETQIAATHSIFNIVNVLLFLAFVPHFAKLLERAVPGKAFKEQHHLTDLDIKMLETPLLAIEQSRHEILTMGEGCSKMLDWLGRLFEQAEHDLALVRELKDREKVLDSIQEEVSQFVTNILAGNVPHKVAEECRQQLRLADEYESVSDYIESILTFDAKLRKSGLRFTEAQQTRIFKMHEACQSYVELVNQAFLDRNEGAVDLVKKQGKEIRTLIKQFRQEHLDELSESSAPPQTTVAFLNTLNAYGRVRDHALNIAETISGEK